MIFLKTKGLIVRKCNYKKYFFITFRHVVKICCFHGTCQTANLKTHTTKFQLNQQQQQQQQQNPQKL